MTLAVGLCRSATSFAFLRKIDSRHATRIGFAIEQRENLNAALRHRAAAFALAVGSVDPAAAQRVKAGLLTCDVSAGIGFIIGSQKTVSCVYAPEPAGPQQVYSGSISKFGLDIGVTSSGVMVWGVFTDSVGPNPGFLAGDYFGATGEVTIAAGLGANVLVGGSNRTVALQPISVDSSVGLNLAVGVAELRLRPGP